jgi:hypothetical protein
MYQIKSIIYLNLDKTQKTSICNHIRALVKQNLEKSSFEILNKFINDEKYYLEINSSRFHFLEEIIDTEAFIKDTEKFIQECIKFYKYKESQRPYIEMQKEFDRKKRKFLQEVKMSKEKPTNKQIYYYDKLCKKYDIEKKDVGNLSKLDLRNEIERIINANSEFETVND